MISNRTVVLSQDEVCEAIKAFVRAKYHEKIERSNILTKVDEKETGSFSFTFEEIMTPYIKKI